MNTIQQLIAIKELLKNEENWCKGAFAKNNLNQAVTVFSESACKFCVNGAIRKVGGFHFGNAAYIPIARAIGVNIALWNDNPETTHEDVMKVLDKAIDNARNV